MRKLVPEGRAKSLAITHLETAAMWASKGVTHAPPDVEFGPHVDFSVPKIKSIE